MQFAVVCPPYAGHLNPMSALGRALHARGHRVAFVGIADAAARMAAAGFAAETVGRDSHPPGTLATLERRLAGLRGPFGLHGVIRDVARMTDMLCRELPAALDRLGADAVLCDQLEPAGALVAEHSRRPCVGVANALMIEREPYIPPPFTGWAYARTPWARERNLGGYRVSDWLMRPVSAVIERWCSRWQLGARRHAEQCLPEMQVGQLSRALDFPREALPPGFHYTGPLRDQPDDDALWSPPADTHGPLAYVSLGSLQGGRAALLGRIAVACREAGLTPVITHGGRLSAAQVAALSGEAIVADWLPQRHVIARCALVVSHGGMNTVLDALALGVPLLLLPLAMEQGAITQRVLRAGAGLACPDSRVQTLRRHLTRLLDEPAWREHARHQAAALAAAGGAPRAARLIERHVH
jgi:zeaxanthin glucosyltransferase